MTEPRTRPTRLPSTLRVFLNNEAISGAALIVGAALAMVAANSRLAPTYFGALQAGFGPLTVHGWTNDGLMSLFFLLVGLEIKRELIDGRLSRWSDRRLPVLAAVAGMAVPALVYLRVSGYAPGPERGWAIPAAADIAIAMAVLALVGNRAPAPLKLLLVTIAIADDLGAMVVMAVFHTAELDFFALAVAGMILVLMAELKFRKVERLRAYLGLAVALWLATLLSGVHATVSGVIAATMIPIRPSPSAPDDPGSPLHRLEHALQPWVAYIVVPLFGFANAGVSLAAVGTARMLAPLPLGIAAGLFIGKQVGIFASLRLSVALGLSSRPAGATWLQVYGMSLLCGIGFTTSLFIGDLAFLDPAVMDQVKIGVLGGSILSATAGYLVLRYAAPSIGKSGRDFSASGASRLRPTRGRA